MEQAEALRTPLAKMHKCHICDKVFKNKRTLTRHSQSHDKSLTCPFCQTAFDRLDRLNQHLKTKHGNTFTCDICHKTFQHKHHLTRHMESHDYSSKSWPCPICHQTFKRKDNLNRHLKVKHPDTQRQPSTSSAKRPHEDPLEDPKKKQKRKKRKKNSRYN